MQMQIVHLIRQLAHSPQPYATIVLLYQVPTRQRRAEERADLRNIRIYGPPFREMLSLFLISFTIRFFNMYYVV